MFIFCFLKSARQWTWIEGLTGTSPSSKKAKAKSYSGHWINLMRLCSLGTDWLRSSFAGADLGVLRDQCRWRCPAPFWAPLEEHSWAGARKAILPLCSALPWLQLERCDQFWAPADKMHMGTGPVEATKMIRRWEHKSYGDRQRCLFSLENRRSGG